MHAPSESIQPPPGEFATLLRGETAAISAWSETWNARRLAAYLAIIVLGAGLLWWLSRPKPLPVQTA